MNFQQFHKLSPGFFFTRNRPCTLYTSLFVPAAYRLPIRFTFADPCLLRKEHAKITGRRVGKSHVGKISC